MTQTNQLFEESTEKKSNPPFRTKSSSLEEINSTFARQSSAQPGRDAQGRRTFDKLYSGPGGP